jgi:hypothetical protein
LTVDNEDKEAVLSLDKEADTAKAELEAEIGSKKSTEKQPEFIRKFSKEESQEERTEIAREIWEKRKKHFKDNETIEVKEQEKNEVIKQLGTLRDQIESYNDASFFTKIKDFFAIKKKEAELQVQLGKQSSIEDELSKSISGRQDLDETKAIIANFYANEKKKWAESSYSKEDIEKNFSEEHLASLSMEDYTTLLKRFPGEMVTHVTRQGVRDHIAMFEHTAGEGEMHNGFKDMSQSKRLLAPLAIKISKAESYRDICKLLNNGEVITYRDAKSDRSKTPTDPRRLTDKLKSITEGNINKEFHDSSGIHLAVEEILDAIYGGERGNEIFVAFPSAHVASQYNFFNSGQGAFKQNESGKGNDMYVWAENEESGINIDAGIVFIPKDAQVDIETGSQFELDDAGRPIEIEQEASEVTVNTHAYKRSDRIIASQEYWEKYFKQNPTKRPSKIVYYESSITPTEALLKWKAENKIIKTGEDTKIDFNKEILNDFKRPGGKESVLSFHRLALEALEEEYSPNTILHCYDKDAFTKSGEEINDAYLKMWKAI